MEENLQIIYLEDPKPGQHPTMFHVVQKFTELQNTYEHVQFKQVVMNWDNLYPLYLIVVTD